MDDRVEPEGLPSEDRFRGTLLGGALGDALGLPYEGRQLDYETVRPLQFVGHHPGRISDDTQQTILVAEILLERGWLDPVELSTRLQDWVSWGVGKGRATVDAIRQLAAGVPWHAAGLPSAGNGAVMRVAPVGLRRWRDRSLRWTEAALSAFPTHHDRMAVASAVVMADAVASLIVTAPEQFDARRFAEGLARTAAAWDPRQVSERRDPASRASLAERLAEVPAYRDAEPAAAIRDHFWSGAFVLESLPAAVWCFLRHPRDPGEALREALRVGHDTDTVASLAGTLAGALNGASRLPNALLEQLEGRDRLTAAAQGLWRASRGEA